MDILEDNDIRTWAQERGIPSNPDTLDVQLPKLPSRYVRSYARGSRSGHERRAAEDLVITLNDWDECLVWITGWGVWPSGENWPQFYAWRGAQNERRSLDVAAGHRFDRNETELLTQLLTLIMENAWDAEILCSRDRTATLVRARISHDEWYELLEAP